MKIARIAHRWFALLTLCLAAAPAFAEWETTRWGMTPEEVIAAVPGAQAVKRKGDGQDVWDHHQLAVAPYLDGEFRTEALFFFQPRSRRLAFVKLELADATQCEAWEKVVIGRYGDGTRVLKDFGLKLLTIEWADPATREALVYSSVRLPDGTFSLCHFIRRQPA